MRVSAVGYAYNSLDEVLMQAKRTAEVTHDHPEGIKGARATAAAIYLARTGSGKDEIRAYIEREFGYSLDASIDDLRPSFTFHVSCQATVPPAIIAFLESTDYEHAIRLAVSLGGDSDTIACIAGGIAQAYYGGVPAEIRDQSLARLDDRLTAVVEDFEARFLSSSVGSG
jgi:ADP-ribosylglycohydrolase